MREHTTTVIEPRGSRLWWYVRCNDCSAWSRHRTRKEAERAAEFHEAQEVLPFGRHLVRVP